MNSRSPLSAEDVLQHGDWVRRLARALTDDRAEAEDLAQEAWVAAAVDEGRAGELGGWLTGVLRKLAAMRARTQLRRERREEGSGDDAPAPTPEVLLERLQVQQLLARLVEDLPEPVRVVVQLRYFEGLTSADIATRLSLPAGTVRWRLKTGIDLLRQRLDASFEGRQARWLALIAPLAPRSEVLTDGFLGVVAMKQKLAVVAAVLLVAIGWSCWPVMSPSPREAALGWRRANGTATPSATSPTALQGPDGPVLPEWLGQPGVSARRVAGRVLLDGKPVQGAVVRLEPEILLAGQPATLRFTDANGAFDFGARPAMLFFVSAALVRQTGATLRVELRDPTVTADALELHLGPCAAELSGRVLDPEGGPIPGAHVRPATGVGVESDRQGRYSLCVPPGEVGLHVDAAGYGALRLSALVFGHTTRDLLLPPEASIVGRVVEQATGAPVAGALVMAEPGHFGGMEAVRGNVTLSRPDGRFELPVGPGDYAVSAVRGAAASGAPFMVSTLVGRLSDDIVLALREESLLQGVVRSKGRPVAGAKVSVFSLSGAGRRVHGYSQSDGTFAIQGAPRGPVMFSAPPFAIVSPRRVVLSEANERVTLEVKGQASLHGRVLRQGKPVSGASVKASAGFAEVETTSDASGRYVLAGLWAGRLRVFANSESVGGFTEVPDVMLSEQESRQLDLELGFAATISGRVVAEDGSPVPGAMVVFTHTETEDTGRGITDSEGRFECRQMTGGGAYRPQVFLSPAARAGFKAAKPMETVALADGSARVDGVVLTVRLERKSLRGRVEDASGSRIPDVVLRAELVPAGGKASFSAWVPLPRTMSDATGGFLFDALPGGSWSVHARAPDGSEAVVDGLVAGEGEATITLLPPSAIEGTLVGYEEPPAAIYARPFPALDRLVSGHQHGSAFRLELPAGTWLVSAMNAHEGDVQRVVVGQGETTRLTMTSRGRGKVSGTVVDYVTGAPVAGLTCHLLSATDGVAGITRWDVETAPHTDETGAFLSEPAPAGEVQVSCVGDWHELSTASALFTVPRGGVAQVPLAVVRRARPPPGGDLGLQFDDALRSGVTAVVPVVRGVREGSAAAKAGVAVGDVVVALDGRQTAPLDASGVEMLIINHAPGSRLTLTVLRAGQRLDFELVSERAQR